MLDMATKALAQYPKYQHFLRANPSPLKVRLLSSNPPGLPCTLWPWCCNSHLFERAILEPQPRHRGRDLDHLRAQAHARPQSSPHIVAVSTCFPTCPNERSWSHNQGTGVATSMICERRHTRQTRYTHLLPPLLLPAIHS